MATNYDTVSLCRETERKWYLYRWRPIECPTAVEGISPEQRYCLVSAGIHSLRVERFAKAKTTHYKCGLSSLPWREQLTSHGIATITRVLFGGKAILCFFGKRHHSLRVERFAKAKATHNKCG